MGDIDKVFRKWYNMGRNKANGGDPAMKMITAIVNKKDANEVCDTLTKHGIAYTKLATTGGFLRASNTTLLIGAADDKVKPVLDLIRRHCAQRVTTIPVAPVSEIGHLYASNSTEVTVGGAIVFVTDVVHFEKM